MNQSVTQKFINKKLKNKINDDNEKIIKINLIIIIMSTIKCHKCKKNFKLNNVLHQHLHFNKHVNVAVMITLINLITLMKINSLSFTIAFLSQ